MGLSSALVVRLLLSLLIVPLLIVPHLILPSFSLPLIKSLSFACLILASDDGLCN